MRVIKTIFTVAVLGTMFSCGNQVKEVKSLESELDSVSYAIGLNMGIGLKQGFDEANLDALTQGIRNGLDSTNLLISEKDIQKILNPYFKKRQEEKLKAKFAENLKAGEDFLTKNKNEEGVITTESGLQYKVLKEGNGEKPAGPTTRVKVHYHGTNLEGKVFDSSVERDTPAEFGLNQVIKGWTEGVQLMNVGAKYKFFIPQELAYGAQQRGQLILPFSALIFEIEILDITKS